MSSYSCVTNFSQSLSVSSASFRNPLWVPEISPTQVHYPPSITAGLNVAGGYSFATGAFYRTRRMFSQKVILFMKGTKDFPQCGFSNNVVQILKSLNVPFETINILEKEILRQGLKEYYSWPTFPQLYIDGEFFGGCGITMEAHKSGELKELLEKALCS